MALDALVHRLYMLRRRVASEERFVEGVLRKYTKPGDRLLDVGCGHGRFFQIIQRAGLRYLGVDVNPETVARGRAMGREVVLADAFTPELDGYCVLLFSHIVEHFEHPALVAMLNSYLSCLRPGGLVIVLTPLENRGFYDDFDHVKPYNPGALRQLFCHSSNQTSGFGLDGRFRELELWFKRDPLWHSHRSSRWHHAVALPLVLLYVATGGIAGRLNGYGVAFQKV